MIQHIFKNNLITIKEAQLFVEWVE